MKTPQWIEREGVPLIQVLSRTWWISDTAFNSRLGDKAFGKLLNVGIGTDREVETDRVVENQV